MIYDLLLSTRTLATCYAFLNQRIEDNQLALHVFFHSVQRRVRRCYWVCTFWSRIFNLSRHFFRFCPFAAKSARLRRQRADLNGWTTCVGSVL